MSIWTKNYVSLKKRFFKAKPMDFSKILSSYRTILIHPVMEPGKEIYTLPAIASIVDKKGKENVDLLINEKLGFFFKDLPSQKIFYSDFSSPFSSNYRNYRNKLKNKKYDIFLDLNRFDDNILTLFAIVPTAKIRICLDCLSENPIFNLVTSSLETHTEVDRNNLILKPLGIKKSRKRINWDNKVETNGNKKKIGIALENDKLALKLFFSLKRWNLNPFLFVNDVKKVPKMKEKTQNECTSLYPLESTYDICASCEALLTSINPVFSIAVLSKKKTLLLLSKNKTFILKETKKMKAIRAGKDFRAFLKTVKNFILPK